MNSDNLVRFAGHIYRYIRDPMPTNTHNDDIWCLGQRYDSHPDTSPPESTQPDSSLPSAPPATSATESIPSDSATVPQKEDEFETIQAQDATNHNAWPPAFLDDLESRIWLTYRSNFSQIAKSTNPDASSSLSFRTRLMQLSNQGGFTSDTGWGCMIRSAQSLLANTLQILDLGRDWRKGEQTDAERRLLALFADDPSAPFSIHRFVEHGSKACGKHPGEWFGPSAAARCIKALVDSYPSSGLRVYIRPDDSSVYEDSLVSIARAPDGSFQPTLILLGTMLGIRGVTPSYREAIKAALRLPQSVGIAGGRPSSSHYFVGTQADHLFYLDPHTTRPLLPTSPSEVDIASCHTRRLRLIPLEEMDPSMLLGFLIRNEEDWTNWKATIDATPPTGTKSIIHVYKEEPSLSGDTTEADYERAVAEVQSCDEDEEDDAII
ncbi:putative cysteine protease atg4, partial [Aureobasidium melanogenum]